MKKLLFIASLLVAPMFLVAQNATGLDPAALLKPLSDQWPSYSGDNTGKRFSLLKQINTTTVKDLSLQWVNAGITTACGPEGTGQANAVAPAAGGFGGFGRGGGGPVAPLIIGGFGDGTVNNCGPTRFTGGILFVNGIIYASSPTDVYAIDARDGDVLWHYYWKYRGGTQLGTRGPSMWHNLIFFELHDDWIVALNATTGAEVWKKEISPFEMQYFSSNAPMVIGDHVIVGTGNDTDEPAYIKSLDPETGEEQWRLYSTPQDASDPALKTWPSLNVARHGGGTSWIPGSYDPETHLYLFGTGNPTPAYTLGRGDGDNLYTGCLLAVNVDTGKIAWYFQTSPHDTHDWDSTETPVLANLMFDGRMRKLVMMATRNGYFYVLDRTTGEHLITRKLGLTNNYASGVDPEAQPKLDSRGQVMRNPNKDATVAGSIVNGDVLNYPPPTFSPDTGLFYVHEDSSLRILYLMDPDPRGSMGLGGTGGGANFSYGANLDAIDYKTGKVKWRHPLTGGAVGETSTAGGVLFLSNGGGIEALEAATGKPLWHSDIGNLSSPPETFLLDGKQHVLATGSTGLYLFVLN